MRPTLVELLSIITFNSWTCTKQSAQKIVFALDIHTIDEFCAPGFWAHPTWMYPIDDAQEIDFVLHFHGFAWFCAPVFRAHPAQFGCAQTAMRKKINLYCIFMVWRVFAHPCLGHIHRRKWMCPNGGCAKNQLTEENAKFAHPLQGTSICL